jgi:SAM-dependent methyltransferase
MSKTLGIRDFSAAFGTGEDEVSALCGELISSLNFTYADCSQETREAIFLDALRKCDGTELSVSGPHRLDDWRRGWGEILQKFRALGGDLKALVPKDLHGGRPMRYKGDYIMPVSNSFEHDFAMVFRHWLYGKYFHDYRNIYEFGCGTGQNLAVMAELFPDKNLFGLDWVPESQELLSALSRMRGWRIQGTRFDAFRPDYAIGILPESLVYTSCALEQLGSAYEKFLGYLLAKRPRLCVNVECLAEYYDENKLFDYVALKYHRKRNYLDGFLTRLGELEREKAIEIIATKRTGVGSLYHEGYMYVIWKIRK